MLPARIIERIEGAISERDGQVMIVSDRRPSLDRIHTDDLPRIAYPSKVSKQTRTEVFFENFSRVQFRTVQSDMFHGKRMDLIVLVDVDLKWIKRYTALDAYHSDVIEEVPRFY